MRKILSMMLAVALVLTTLAIPMSAFAADPVMTVTYAIDSVNDAPYTNGAEIYPGDKVVVSVSLSADVETTVSYLQFQNTVTNSLDGEWTMNGITNTSTTNKDEDVIVESDVEVTTDGIQIMTGEFTMPDAIQNYTITAADDFVGLPGTTNAEEFSKEFNTLVINSVTISVVQPDNVIKVDGSELSADAVPTVYAQSATITWTSESSLATAEYSLGDAEAVPIAKDTDVPVTEAGTYVITVKYGNGLTYECSFKLSRETVTGTISTTIGLLEDATEPVVKYKREETFTVPVVLTVGPSEDIVGSVAFTVDYDDTVLSMAKAETDDNVRIEGNEVTYEATVTEGDPNDLLSKDETVATLTFTVLPDADYGNTEIKFAGVGLAIEGVLNNTDQALGVTQESTSILVMPEEPLAAITDGDLKTSWVNEAYTVGVTVNEQATAKLYVADAITDSGSQADYKTWFDAGTAVDGSITIESYQDYAIVTKLGEESPVEYQVVIIKAADTKFDNTKPEVTPAAGMTDWLRTDETAQTIEISKFATVADAIPADGAITAEYYIGEAADPIEWTESTDGNIAIDQNSEAETVTIKWTDEAGNETEAKPYDLKLDATAPVINVTAPGAAVEGVKTATFTVTDAVGEVATESIKVYTSTAGEITSENVGSATETTVTTGTDNYSFSVSQPTYYYIVASDKAGIAAAPVSGQITFTAATATTELDVQVVKNGSTLKFYDTTAMADKYILTKEKTAHTGNGTFTYVNITLPAEADEVDRTVTLTKDGVADERPTYTFDATVDGDIGAYVLTITNTDASGTEATSTFEFSIVAAENIMTVNGNNVYDVADYGRVRDLVEDSKTAPESGALFYGGYYSGDLTGDGSYLADDYNDLIINLRARIKDPADSNYPILNKEAAAE